MGALLSGFYVRSGDTNSGLHTFYAANILFTEPHFHPQQDIFIHAHDILTTFTTINFPNYKVIIPGL